jgi:hypothetical protein
MDVHVVEGTDIEPILREIAELLLADNHAHLAETLASLTREKGCMSGGEVAVVAYACGAADALREVATGNLKVETFLRPKGGE